MNETDKRIINGINYFRREMHGEFNGEKKVYLNVLFNLIEERLKGNDVHVTVLNEEPRGFNPVDYVFPESEGFKKRDVNAGGLNNAKSESPDNTASRQLEDASSQ